MDLKTVWWQGWGGTYAAGSRQGCTLWPQDSTKLTAPPRGGGNHTQNLSLEHVKFSLLLKARILETLGLGMLLSPGPLTRKGLGCL